MTPDYKKFIGSCSCLTPVTFMYSVNTGNH